MLHLQKPTKLARRESMLLVLALLAGIASLGQLVLFAQDNSFLDGICAALGTHELAPEARAVRLFRWTTTYDDDAPPTDPAGASLAHDLHTPRTIVEHPAYFRADCGSKARLLAALSQRAGLKARELRLCDSTHIARHVVCEVWLRGRWVVFDPTIGLDFRRRDGWLATAAELRDPALLAANAARVSGYDPRRWPFDHAERLHFEKLPLLGGLLRRLGPRLTGRPAEELALPAAFDRPRLMTAGSCAILFLLALTAAGWSVLRRRRAAVQRALRTRLQPPALVPEAEPD